MMSLHPHQQSRPSANQKLALSLGVFTVFGLTVALYFIFALLDIPFASRSGPNLIENPGFEKWDNNKPVGWENNNAFLFQEPGSVIEGSYSAGIYAKDDVQHGLSQYIALDSTEVYNLHFALKSPAYNRQDVGVLIKYKGTNIYTTVDVTPGVHHYDGNKGWRQYFGRFTGAQGVELFFFSSNNNILLIDDVGVGINLVPARTNEDTLIQVRK